MPHAPGSLSNIWKRLPGYARNWESRPWVTHTPWSRFKVYLVKLQALTIRFEGKFIFFKQFNCYYSSKITFFMFDKFSLTWPSLWILKFRIKSCRTVRGTVPVPTLRCSLLPYLLIHNTGLFAFGHHEITVRTSNFEGVQWTRESERGNCHWDKEL